MRRRILPRSQVKGSKNPDECSHNSKIMGNHISLPPTKQQAISTFFRNYLKHWEDDNEAWTLRETFDIHMARYRVELTFTARQMFNQALEVIHHADHKNVFFNRIWLRGTIMGYIENKERAPNELLLLYEAAQERERLYQKKHKHQYPKWD